MNNANFSLDEVRSFSNLLGENIARLPFDRSTGSPMVDVRSVADLFRNFTVYANAIHTMKGVEEALREMGFSAIREESSNLHTADASQMVRINVYCETDLNAARSTIERALDRNRFQVEMKDSWLVVTLKPH